MKEEADMALNGSDAYTAADQALNRHSQLNKHTTLGHARDTHVNRAQLRQMQESGPPLNDGSWLQLWSAARPLSSALSSKCTRCEEAFQQSTGCPVARPCTLKEKRMPKVPCLFAETRSNDHSLNPKPKLE